MGQVLGASKPGTVAVSQHELVKARQVHASGHARLGVDVSKIEEFDAIARHLAQRQPVAAHEPRHLARGIPKKRRAVRYGRRAEMLEVSTDEHRSRLVSRHPYGLLGRKREALGRACLVHEHAAVAHLLKQAAPSVEDARHELRGHTGSHAGPLELLAFSHACSSSLVDNIGPAFDLVQRDTPAMPCLGKRARIAARREMQAKLARRHHMDGAAMRPDLDKPPVPAVLGVVSRPNAQRLARTDGKLGL